MIRLLDHLARNFSLGAAVVLFVAAIPGLLLLRLLAGERAMGD